MDSTPLSFRRKKMKPTTDWKEHNAKLPYRYIGSDSKIDHVNIEIPYIHSKMLNKLMHTNRSYLQILKG